MITITEIALRATVQDAGRTRHLRLGVPSSGPVDRVAHAAANVLVGNHGGAAALEIVGLPFAFRAERPLLVAATGPEVRLEVRGTIPGWTSAFARAGDEVRVTGTARYAYVAVSGEIDLPPLLGSRAAYPAAGLGPAPLRVGERVPIAPARADPALSGRSFEDVPAYGSGRARVLVGPHDARVDAAAFLTSEYRVDLRSDRMGVRLTGPALAVRGGELLTCGVVEGAIQVPPGGTPIVLLADHQTTGGYPVVATVIAADLPIVAQAPAGSTLRFVRTTRAEAVAALQRVRRALALRPPDPEKA